MKCKQMSIKMQQKCWPTTAISNPVIDGIGDEQCNILTNSLFFMLDQITLA